MAKNKPQVPEDVASKRLQIILPLLDETLDPARLIELKKKSAKTRAFPTEALAATMQLIANMDLPESSPNRVISARIIPCRLISPMS